MLCFMEENCFPVLLFSSICRNYHLLAQWHMWAVYGLAFPYMANELWLAVCMYVSWNLPITVVTIKIHLVKHQTFCVCTFLFPPTCLSFIRNMSMCKDWGWGKQGGMRVKGHVTFYSKNVTSAVVKLLTVVTITPRPHLYKYKIIKIIYKPEKMCSHHCWSLDLPPVVCVFESY